MKPLEISSPQNSVFKQLLILTESRGIKKSNRFLVSGPKLIAETIKYKRHLIESVILPTGSIPSSSHKLAESQQIPQIILANPLFQQLDTLGTNAPLLVCTLPEIENWDPTRTECGSEVLLTQGDPGNLGAAIRSCVAFDAGPIVLLKEAANPFHPRAVRASAGACMQATFYLGPAIEELANFNIENVLMLDLEGETLETFTWPAHFRLLIGREGQGSTNASGLKATKLHIPMAPRLDSLNATIALSIALYARKSQSPPKSRN